MLSNVERDSLYESLITNKHFLHLFDVLQFTQKQFETEEGKSTSDLSDEIWGVVDEIQNYIMTECNLYLDEYDLFLAQNNLTYHSERILIEKTMKEQGFSSDYASREAYENLLCHYRCGNKEGYTKEQIIKQLVFWDQSIILGDDVEFTNFQYNEPRYRMINFSKK